MNGKKFLVIGLLSLFMISMFAGIVVAQDPGVGSFGGEGFWADVTDFLRGGLEEGSGGAAVFSRILLIILVTLLVYSVSGMLPFMDTDKRNKELIKWGVSIVVAILAFVYVKEETIRALLLNYEALGVMLTTVIPLIILITFIIQLGRHSPFTAHIVNPILTVGFVVYILTRWYSIPASPLRTVYPVTLVVLVIWLFAYKRIMKWFGEEKVQTLVGKYRRQRRLATARQREDAKAMTGEDEVISSE